MAEINSKVLTVDSMNPNVKRMEYAVRGPIVQKARKLEEDLEQGVKKPFTEVVRANIGDCHATGQKPLTFLRQVIGIATLPELLNDEKYPADVKDRAQRILSACKGRSIGSYSESAGLQVIRQDVAKFISERDGHPCDYNNIFLSTGASDAIKTILSLVNSPTGDKKTGVMIPIPQYPLYSATVAEFNMYQVSYYLDEDNHWALNIEELKRAIDESRSLCNPAAIVVINPGNPTGQVLSRKNIEDIIRFAHQEKLVILADEVYQHNVYAEGRQFHSFKKVLSEMGPEFSNQQLASFMSTSKGYMGECGYRGGYCEVMNFDPDVLALLYKCISVKLCPPISGQVAVDCVVNPPLPDEPSYEIYMKERCAVLESLKQKAKIVSQTFNAIDGITCNEVQGAMYCFPRLHLPEKAVNHAKAQGVTPDSFYCFELLENTGLCVVPGSGFGQKDGTYHFRCTILPQIGQFQQVMERFKAFHKDFMAKWQ